MLFDPHAEDIHMFIEAELTKRYPESGKKLHTARSRNDQVALDLRLYTRDEIKDIQGMLMELMQVLINQAKRGNYTYHYVWLYTFATCSTHNICPSFNGLC